MIKTCCGLLEQRNIKIAFIESASSGYLTSQFSICKNEGAGNLVGRSGMLRSVREDQCFGNSPNLISTHSAESMPVTVALAEAGKNVSGGGLDYCLYRLA